MLATCSRELNYLETNRNIKALLALLKHFFSFNRHLMIHEICLIYVLIRFAQTNVNHFTLKFP